MYKKIYVEITNNCNLKCDFCIKNERKIQYMKLDNFKKILNKIESHTKYLYFHILGEPLMHPEINDFIENAEVHNGDLLFTRKNTPELVGMATYVFSTPKNLMMPDLIFRLNTKEICSKIFLWQLINHNLFRGKVQNIASGSAKSMSNISKERLGKMSIYLPPIELQNQFAEFVKATDKSKAAIQKSLDETQLLFDSLMQKYFG